MVRFIKHMLSRHSPYRSRVFIGILAVLTLVLGTVADGIVANGSPVFKMNPDLASLLFDVVIVAYGAEAIQVVGGEAVKKIRANGKERERTDSDRGSQ